MSDNLDLNLEEFLNIKENEIVENYIKYAQSLLILYQETEKCLKENNLSLNTVNKALRFWLETSMVLVQEYNRIKTKYNILNEGFQIWFDEKYIEIREEYNKNDIAGTKWLSKSEIDSMVRKRNKIEYLNWKIRLNELGSELSTIKRLTNNYSQLARNLEVISNNLRFEYSAEPMVDNIQKKQPRVRK